MGPSSRTIQLFLYDSSSNTGRSHAAWKLPNAASPLGSHLLKRQQGLLLHLSMHLELQPS